MATTEQQTRAVPSDPARPRAGEVIVDTGPGACDRAMTVVPLVADGRVAGFEVRCRCGDRIVVECVEGERCAPEA